MPDRSTTAKKGPKTEQIFGTGPVRYSLPKGVGGPIHINIDFAQASVPRNYSYADSFLLTRDEDLRTACLSFGRRSHNTNQFADRIDVVMPMTSLFQQFWASSKELQTTVDKILEATGAAPKPRPISAPESPAPTVFANILFLAIGAEDCTFDFYHMTPREVHLAKTQRKDIQLQAVIRVITSTVLVKFFFDALRPHATDSVNYGQIVEGSRRAVRPR